MSDDKRGLGFLCVVHACVRSGGRWEKKNHCYICTNKLEQGWRRYCTCFFMGSPAWWGWIVIPNTAPASISSSPRLFYEAKLACSRANSLHCSSSVTGADGFCALKCSCSLTLAAVDSHGNFWVGASSLVTLWRWCRLCLNLFVERSYQFTINNLNVSVSQIVW